MQRDAFSIEKTPEKSKMMKEKQEKTRKNAVKRHILTKKVF